MSRERKHSRPSSQRVEIAIILKEFIAETKISEESFIGNDQRDFPMVSDFSLPTQALCGV